MIHKLIHKKSIIKLVVFFSIFSLLSAGFPVPPYYPPVAQAFTVGEEREVGEKLLSIIRKEFKLLDAPDISQYVSDLGRDILKVAGSQYFDYNFFVIENKDFNAFAAPSGLIFIHSGLIETMNTEGELLGVMAHECAHVTSRHIAERLQKSAKVNVGTMALLLAGIMIGAGPISEAMIAGSIATNAAMNLNFSRADEEESDRLAFSWMQKMGRDPASIVSMLQKMRKISILQMGDIPPYLLTHPDPGLRMNYVQDLLLTTPEMSYQKNDEFDFQRIKARVLALTKDAAQLYPKYNKIIADPQAEPETKAMAYYGLSQVYLETNELAKAEKSLAETMKLYPDRPILETDLGIIYFQAGEYGKALKNFTEAQSKDPDCSYTSFFMAKTLEQKGDKTGALRLYKQLAITLPTFSEIQYRLGKILTDTGKPGEAHYHIGIYNWYEGDIETAKYHLQEAIKVLEKTDPIQNKAQEMLVKIIKFEKN
ncbi:MAG: M48 family metalloprotease [Proteobacteria bacterium]|nr:M48 family metalloprotease [Pseudomonadota bacterium]MBU1716302.1 M48 family metalloprotease [Pseudomonadota bacterium]